MCYSLFLSVGDKDWENGLGDGLATPQVDACSAKPILINHFARLQS